MRLWHYKLIPVLPKKQLVSQWRECISIKRRWEQNKPDSPLVMYVRNHSKLVFMQYVFEVVKEMDKRKIKYKKNFLTEFIDFCGITSIELIYPEHNDRYLKQCYYNLQEKYDRGIITEEEYNEILNTVTVCLNSSVQQIKELL